MGTHNSGPTFIKGSQITLKSVIESNPETYLGKNLLEKWQIKELPFLFKVLSIETCLSIQTHPDKNLAVKLHQTNKEHYPDANPKPEMCIALDQFEALIGFATGEEILKFLKEFQILKENQNNYIKLLESNDQTIIKDALKQLLTQLFILPNDDISTIVQGIIKQIESKSETTKKEKLLLKLNSQFPQDIGIIFAGLLNYIQAKPGDCFVIDANEPHAYVQGNCIECMACSDNVVRAGLTPKFKDSLTLINILQMLSYQLNSLNEIKPKIFNNDKYQFILYQPQYKEFQCFRLEISEKSEGTTEIFLFENPSILIIIEGNANFISNQGSKQISKGNVLFISPQQEFRFDLNSCFQVYICNCQ